MNIDKYIVNSEVSIKEAMKTLDAGGIGFLCIYKDNKIFGVITDGDIRRAILNNVSLDSSVETIVKSNFIFVDKNFSRLQIENIFKTKSIRHIPVVENNKLLEIITFESFFEISKQKTHKTIDTEVVIMAGGKGSRLLPLTHILPKPLIPIGEKSILEIIIDEFTLFGISKFYISVNYKAALIKAYFDEANLLQSISFVEESEPLGTAGALKFLENKIEKPFFVSNCDIIIKSDYNEIYNFHLTGNFDATIVASMQHFKIPYGVCNISNGGELIDIVEKPEYNFLVNTGMYVLSPNVLKLIPYNQFFHITDLFEKIKKHGGRIGVYPVSENSWIDIGQMEEYKKVLKNISFE